MLLRFSVNQAEAFRRGINEPKSIVTVEVDPSALDEDWRIRISRRMKGIDICQLDNHGKRKMPDAGNYVSITEWMIETYASTLKALQEAIMAEDNNLTDFWSSGLMEITDEEVEPAEKEDE